ncbi:TetR/AcrR family transcriptional regulator [Methylobacterium gnaphalii]|uniref:TetR family transcriptional regulator n=1 Tax=Methylobacterium gnaphalii TaxID=1010610 RepID=A0A512JRP2_9HYPH|nr:TetR/AcrR family transcriptional regulator [Methylobacterium gnaphalii]GEP12627.1 TetR family transcriptional regulator [Methylobacterium gnaphalii]GJD71715.1 hypothetical protein MMMDOFMJ_4678 [Methylobacterium gnaphalii]GLS48884.1 TetR family transcriptional regulator [Methylobacterium gnaphalii]
MGRPREFNEAKVLDAAVQCFWSRGFEATSMRDLIDRTGLTGASLYNAFGDKRALYQRALQHYVDESISDRLRRCETMPPRQAIASFFDEIVERSLSDREHRGCMLVNAAFDTLPCDAEFRLAVADVMIRIEKFFKDKVLEGQRDRMISHDLAANDVGAHLLGVLLGIRVLARVRPERDLLERMAAGALAMLEFRTGKDGLAR